MPKFSNKKIFISISIAFLFVTGVFCATLLSSFVLPASTQVAGQVKSNQFEIHFLALNKSTLSSSASTLAKDVQSLGGGGYVWKNGEYFYVVSSAYANKNDAVLVQNNLKSSSIDSEIFSVTFPSIVIEGGYDSESKKVLGKAVNIFETSYLALFDVAISLDTQVYNEISARLAINSNHANINSVIADFQTLFSQSDDSKISALSIALSSLSKISANLCSGVIINSGQTYSSLIKYRYTEILSLLSSLCENMNKS